MRLHFSFFLLIVLIFAFSCNSLDTKPIISDDAKLELLSEQFSFTEGPTADSNGNVYFTDQPNNKIYQYRIDGTLELFMDKAGRSNGLYFDQEGSLWACADAFNQLLKIGADKELTVVLNKDSLSVFNGPNDVWVHGKGYVFFTDPLYQRPYWSEPHDTLQYQGLYTLSPSGEAILLDSSLVQPNGIIGDSKNNLLYVADIGSGNTYQYTISEKGELDNKKLFINKGSDGMALDNLGNLYITGNGVDIFNTNGELIHHLDVAENWTANVCFGGKDFDELFITASKSLYKIKTNVKGVK